MLEAHLRSMIVFVPYLQIWVRESRYDDKFTFLPVSSFVSSFVICYLIATQDDLCSFDRPFIILFAINKKDAG